MVELRGPVSFNEFMERRIDTYLRHLLPEEKFDFYSVVRDFSDNEIGPKILDWEREHCLLPDDVIAKMGDLGLFGLPIEEEYGGQGGDQTDLVLMGLALGYHSMSAAITPGAAISLGAKPVQLCGTDAQKRAHLPDLAAGKRMFVFGLSANRVADQTRRTRKCAPSAMAMIGS